LIESKKAEYNGNLLNKNDQHRLVKCNDHRDLAAMTRGENYI
jgi:hypothetical protein